MNTLLLTLNLSLTAGTGVLVAKDIYLHLNTEKMLKNQITKVSGNICKYIALKSIDIENAIRGESEIAQDQVQDIKAEIDGVKDKLVKEVKTDLETINWNIICTNKIMDRALMVTVVKKE